MSFNSIIFYCRYMYIVRVCNSQTESLIQVYWNHPVKSAVNFSTTGVFCARG